MVGTSLAYDYRGVVARGLATAKLSGAHAAWPDLVTPLVVRLLERPPPVDVVTWVPTPRVRVRTRGLDHAERVARLVAAPLGLPAVRLLDVQVRRDGRDHYRSRRDLPGTEVLLVDDILTTGATAWRAATALRAAGSGQVRHAVLARAGTHALGP